MGRNEEWTNCRWEVSEEYGAVKVRFLQPGGPGNVAMRFTSPQDMGRFIAQLEEQSREVWGKERKRKP